MIYIMNSIDDFPRDQNVLPEHFRSFCIYLLDLLKGTDDKTFMNTVERISPVEITLSNATFKTDWMPSEIRERLTELPIPVDGDEVFADLRFTGSPNGKVSLGQLSMQHSDSGHKLVLSAVAEDAATIVDYEETGQDRKVIIPEDLLQATLLGLMFGTIPEDLDDEKWHNIVRYFEQRSPVVERSRVLVHDTKIATTTLRIVEREGRDTSTDAIELTVLSKFATNIAYNRGIRITVTENGIIPNISAHSDQIKTLNSAPINVEDLDYVQAFVGIDEDNNTWPCFPTESDIGTLEVALQELIEHLASANSQ